MGATRLRYEILKHDDGREMKTRRTSNTIEAIEAGEEDRQDEDTKKKAKKNSRSYTVGTANATPLLFLDRPLLRIVFLYLVCMYLNQSNGPKAKRAKTCVQNMKKKKIAKNTKKTLETHPR